MHQNETSGPVPATSTADALPEGARRPGPTSVAPASYREAMTRLASAVHVVTTDGPGGRAGFTASAVCSVSDAPPTLLVCLNRAAASHPVFAQNGVLCVNTLGAGHEEIAAAFGGKLPPADRFGLGAWGRLATGAPVLAGGLIAFDCRIVTRSPVGTHDVLFCEVLALADAEVADPARGALLYAGRRYHALASGEPTTTPPAASHTPAAAPHTPAAAPHTPAAASHARGDRLRERPRPAARPLLCRA